MNRVLQDENLFVDTNIRSLRTWSSDRKLCQCDVGKEHYPVNLVTCESDMTKTCKDSRDEPAFEDRCSVGTRRKRSTDGQWQIFGADFHKTSETTFVPMDIYSRSIHKENLLNVRL